MNDTAVFDEFVRDRAPSLLRTAYLLTRDHGHAEDLLQTALARSWGAWRRIDGNPEPYVRQVLVNTYASWRGRRWHGERPSEVLPEPPGASPHAAVDDRDEIWRALDRLPRQQRAVLVLRYFEDLPETQIADALGIPVGSVKSSAARALATLRLDGSLRPDGSLPDDLLDVPLGPPVERVSAVRGRIYRQRGRRVATVAAAFIAVLALILAYVFGSHLSLEGAHEPIGPGAGSYRDGYHVVARASGPFDQPPSVTWTPTMLDAQIFIDCSMPVIPKHPTWTATAYIGDDPVSGTYSCPTDRPGRGYSVGNRFDEVPLSAKIHIGEPAVVTLRIAPDGGPADATPPAGTVTLAVGEAATFAEYPLPPRPAQLPTMHPRPTSGSAGPGSPGHVIALFGPGLPATVSVPATGEVGIGIETQTPGFVEIKITGQPTKIVKVWEYGVSQGYSIDIGHGTAPVTITVSGEYMTGDWYVSIMQMG